MAKTTSYKLNADGTIKVITKKDTEFSKRLNEKYQTPNADKLLKEKPEMEEFDTHKFRK